MIIMVAKVSTANRFCYLSNSRIPRVLAPITHVYNAANFVGKLTGTD